MGLNKKRLTTIAGCLLFMCSNLPAFAEDVPTSQSPVLPPVAPNIQSTEASSSLQTAGDSSADAQFSGEISDLEQKLLRREYPDQPVDKRLDRIERAVYGKTKSGSVSQRVTNLLLDVPNLSSSASIAQTASTQNTAEPTEEAHDSEAAIKGPELRSLSSDVSRMEKLIFNKTYTSNPLVNRVDRLENVVFAQQANQTFSPLPDRIYRLMQTLHQPIPTPQIYTAQTPIMSSAKQSRQDADQDESKKGHPFLHKLGRALGEIGMLAGQSLGSMAMSSMMGGYGYGGYGYGGYGYGAYGYPGYGYPNMGAPAAFMGW